MLQTYQKYLVKSFLTKIFNVMSIFFLLILILNIFEEISFFKELKINFFFIIFLTVLNIPSLLFTIFPFIFLISSLLFFLDLVNKNELEILKVNGLNNLKIIKILFFTSLIAGIFLSLIFYNISAKLKFVHLELKNNYSTDNKYLAMVTENGIWIKDEIDDSINIINANKVDNQFLLDVSITQFDENFELTHIIKSEKVDISSYKWKIINPVVLTNDHQNNLDEMELQSNFDYKKINSLFSNLSSLTIIELFKLRKSYVALNYSVVDIDSHLYKIISYPFYLTLMTILAAIIMFNIGYQKNSFFRILLGIFLSVIIYYINYFFNILGTNEKIPLIVSIFMPMIMLSIINLISIIKLNEK